MRRPMGSGGRVSLVGPAGELRPPGQVAGELRKGPATDVVLLEGHLFGTIPTYARLLCRQLATVKRPWVVQADAAALDRALLRLARRSGCRGLVVGPDPDPMRRTPDGIVEPDRLRAAAADLRRIRRAGLLSVVHLSLGRPGDDAGVFGRAVWLCKAGRVAFPRLTGPADDTAASGLGPDEVQRGLEWARRALHTHRAIWRRTGRIDAAGRGALDAHAARTLVARVRRAIGRTQERIVIDLGGLERVSSTVLTRFLEEHAADIEALRGRLAFRNLRPALDAVRRNLHGMLPNAA